jgi:hypothetical protein
MIPEPCVATIDGLPATGGTVPVLLVAAALLATGAGVAILLAARSRRRGATGAALALAALIGCALLAAPPTPARAAGSVTYGAGCTLLRIDDVAVDADALSSLVPGSEVRAISARVVNPTGAPIRILLAGGATTALRDVVALRTGVGTATTDAADIAPGGSVDVVLLVGLPGDAGDAAQGLSGHVSLTVTATQR